MMNWPLKNQKRLAVAVIGIAKVFLPGRAIMDIPPALDIFATEFA
ncbi:MAG: hypothetical protein HZC44_03415 [Geobacter sp.]|nr:hypothetical protein [Geobacter sp.]